MTEVVRSEQLNLREVWSSEASHFTPWLAQHLGWLAEDLGLGELTLSDTEVTIPGGRSLDILAFDAEGRAVAIENQYGVIDHDHLTRGLAYAVGLRSTDIPVEALVVVAESHRDEFVAVADYLNECAAARSDEGISVFLVEVHVERIGASPPAVRFKAVAQPNEWEAAVRRSAPARRALTLDEIVAGLPEAAAATATAIHSDWEGRGDATWVFEAYDSLVLFARNPRAASGRCHVGSLFTSQVSLNPGRLAESGAFEDADLEELDRMIKNLLPPTTSTGKGYYLHFQLGEVESDALSRIFDFILGRLASSLDG